ncbi:adenosine deaminase [Echinimonas agarilytica]|uniref:adenosine deaminase n=1 Tax=Echinimonas agarilytica TaxID=1215918 RepID=A0AA42B7M4_9GAMM|nr:adenosine deaminase [Echinimonas agarilytica]MCM2679882.1 adenosine deaminase [Echinimonas agarilytica]
MNQRLPVVDLHRHLDGNIRVSTIVELAAQHDLVLPAHTVEEMAPYVQVQGKENDLLGFLKKLDWMVAVLADLDAVKRVAYENVEDAVNSGLDYTELRFSPYYMAMTHQLNLNDVVAAVMSGVDAGRADFGAHVNVIGIMSRSFGQQACQQELEAILNFRDDFVAVDLAGDERGFPSSQFESHFKQVRDAGLGITVHAGEAAGAESVWHAVRSLGASRIGHGVRSVEDPALMEYLAQHRIGIESCPTSNLHTSTVSSYDTHPLRQFLEADICIGLNTDDPGVSAIDIAHEYRIAKHELGLTDSQITQLQHNGLEMAFLSKQERQQLISATQSRNS